MFGKTAIATSIIILGLSGTAFAQGAPGPDTVRQTQQELQAQGLYHGQIDGKLGDETRAAIREFQSHHGLTPNGRLTRRTVTVLHRVASGAPVSPNYAAGSRAAPSGSPLRPGAQNPRANPGPSQPPSGQ